MFAKWGLALGVLALGVSNAFAADCDARVGAPWNATQQGPALISEAIATGPDCERAVVTLVIRSPHGDPIWVDGRVASQLMTFAGVKTKGAMMKALADWISQKNAMMPRADKLPDWPQGAEGPQSGEFPFHPEADVDRDVYLAIRRSRAPLFCYVQGMESMACVALNHDGTISKVGVQQFPG